MNSRMRRFWFSLALAAGSLAFPLSGLLRSHDLPTRWTSGANSTPSWHFLLDDCLDTASLGGPDTLDDPIANYRSSTQPWASTEPWAQGCPAEWAANTQASVASKHEQENSALATGSADRDMEQLLRNPISRFSKEMTCWVNEWHQLQSQAAFADSQVVADTQIVETPLSVGYAALPDEGVPPSPAWTLWTGSPSFATQEPVVDTCEFAAEYQSQQSAAELLSNEIARATAISQREASLAQALQDAADINALVAEDTLGHNEADAAVNEYIDTQYNDQIAQHNIDAGADEFVDDMPTYLTSTTGWAGAGYIADESQVPEQTSASDIAVDHNGQSFAADQIAAIDKLEQPSLCGGEPNEILSMECFPNQGPSRFAPGIVDELLADHRTVGSINSHVASGDEQIPDEYIPYDLEERDSHWLIGPGQAGRLRSALEKANLQSLSAREQSRNSSYEATEEVIAIAEPTPVINPETTIESIEAQALESSALESSALEGPAFDSQSGDTRLLNQYLDDLLTDSKLRTNNWLERAQQVAGPIAQAVKLLPDVFPSRSQQLNSVMELIDLQQCWIAAELRGFDHLGSLSEQAADAMQQASHVAMHNLVALGKNMSLDSGMEVYVVYIDADGTRLAVPGDVARSWNRPEREIDEPDTSVANWSHSQVQLPEDQIADQNLSVHQSITAEASAVAETMLGVGFAEGSAAAEAKSWPVDIDTLKAQTLEYLAAQLNSMGLAFIQTSDQLTQWARPHVASRQDADVR